MQPIAQLGGRAAVLVADEIDHQARTARGRDKTVIARHEWRQHRPECAIGLPFPAVMGIGGALGAEPRCHPVSQLARVGGVVVGDLDAAAGIFGVKITIAFPSTPDPLPAIEIKRCGRAAANDAMGGAFQGIRRGVHGPDRFHRTLLRPTNGWRHARAAPLSPAPWLLEKPTRGPFTWRLSKSPHRRDHCFRIPSR